MVPFLHTLSKLERAVLLSGLGLAGSAILAVLSASMGLLYPVISVSLLLPAYFTFQSISLLVKDLRPTWPNIRIKIATTLLAFTLISHFIGVLLPEVGFDALWYHLPLIRIYIEQHRLVYDAVFYQSLYPQLGDFLLALGFQVAGVSGAKLIAYWTGVLLLMISYVWLRKHCSQVWSILMVTVIGLFQVIGWQMSSAYVDVISAVWLLAGIWLLVALSTQEENKNAVLLLSTFFLACFLGTKFINLGLIPLLAGVLIWKIGTDSSGWRISHCIQQWRVIGLMTSILLAVAGFWFLRAYHYTGNFLYPVGDPSLESLFVQMQFSSWSEWLKYRFANMYRLPWEFFVTNDSYLTILIPVFVLCVLYLVKKGVKIQRELTMALLIGAYGVIFWWFFPPPSTRYVLGQMSIGFIGLAIVVGKNMQSAKGFVSLKQLLYSFVIASILTHLAIRFAVNTRGIPYLLGIESQQEYLDRYRNGFTDDKINNWYGETTE